MKIFQMNNHITVVALILLTLFSVWLAQANIATPVLAILATLSVILKGQQIVDIFMELYHAPVKWRYLLLSYVVIIPLILAIIVYS
jgi:hypothetical protein